MTNSISARQSWAESQTLRTTILSNMFEKLGLIKKEDISQDLKPHRIRNDNLAVNKIKDMTKVTMNPFDSCLDPATLFNIGTGKGASENTERFLLNLNNTGDKARRTFISECVEDPSRFESRIPRQKLYTFATECAKKQHSTADGKVIAASMVRNLFGSILYLSLQRKIDMEEVLKYPLTPIPLSLSHVDGTMLKSTKSALLKNLESRVQTLTPTSIIDASFFYHLHGNLPATFGATAKYLLKRIMESVGDVIHFVNDKWIKPSIKDIKREGRESSSVMYRISGPAQKRPGNWISSLRNDCFKISLVEFLINNWELNNMSDIFKRKTLYANCGNKCYMYKAVDDTVVRTEVTELYSNHEEADSRMFFHLAYESELNNVVIRTADTDCLIIALDCLPSLNPYLRLWLEVRLQSNNSIRFISVNQLFSKLGTSISHALPAYHAFTGCDYTASFIRKGKLRPLTMREFSTKAQEAFATL